MPVPQRLESGKRLADNDQLNDFLATPTFQTNGPITALAGGGRSASTPPLLRGVNIVGTVATTGDSVVLRKAMAGAIVIVRNAGANAMQVFASGSDTINGTAGSTGISVASGKSVIFFATSDSAWFSLLSA